jgi:hypothetical protein
MSKKAQIIDESIDLIDNKLEYLPFFPTRFICYVISFASIYLMIFSIGIGGLLVGLFFLVLTFPIAISQKRITVDLTNLQYMEYLSFFGIKFGKWNSFKGFRIITITHSDKIIKMNATYGGAEATSNSTSVFYLNLKKDNYNKINIAAGSYKEVFSKALELSHRFEMDILDCSEKPNKKLDYDFISKNYPDHSL